MRCPKRPACAPSLRMMRRLRWTPLWRWVRPIPGSLLRRR